MKPVRLRLSRRAGFDLQALSRACNGLEAVAVTRPSRWGNPFRMEDRKDVAVRERVIMQFELWLQNSLPGQELAAMAQVELRGKNLACYCAPTDACHADVLLQIANGGSP